jgi:hypothetical protein
MSSSFSDGPRQSRLSVCSYSRTNGTERLIRQRSSPTIRNRRWEAPRLESIPATSTLVSMTTWYMAPTSLCRAGRRGGDGRGGTGVIGQVDCLSPNSRLARDPGTACQVTALIIRSPSPGTDLVSVGHSLAPVTIPFLCHRANGAPFNRQKTCPLPFFLQSHVRVSHARSDPLYVSEAQKTEPERRQSPGRNWRSHLRKGPHKPDSWPRSLS